MLGTDVAETRIVYHALKEEVRDLVVVLEEPVKKGPHRRRRIKRHGLAHVVGQMMFSRLVLPFLVRGARARVEAIKSQYSLDDSRIDGCVLHVRSANSGTARELLRKLDPRVVVVSGARILNRKTLSAVDAPFVNLHGGITPRYRGVYGGYWALVDCRPDLFGTTIHFIDEGIDTGEIIRQAVLEVTSDDCAATYPYLHAAAGVGILAETIHGILKGSLSTNRVETELPSKLWSYPTIWGYLSARISRGIK